MSDQHIEYLTSMLDEIFQQAEDLIGPRKTEIGLTWIRFEGARPQIVLFPDGDNVTHVGVKLSTFSLQRANQGFYGTAYHELSHECIHTFEPVRREKTTNLEEGVATWFANLIYWRKFDHAVKTSEIHVDYLKSCQLVQRMISKRKDSLKKLREKTSSISSISAEQILEAWPQAGQKNAEFLASYAWPTA